MIQTLRKSIPTQQIVYLNFEDERLDLSTADLDLILQAYRELYPDNNLAQCYFLFDEIQNVAKWEQFIRRIDDTISHHLLRKQDMSINFIRGKQECDFVLQSTDDQTLLPIQVCYDLTEASTHKREVAGLIAACKFCKTSKGIILTMDQEAQLQENGINIDIIPVWKYLLG